MTVAELIAKLQEMPQDLEVEILATDISATVLSDAEEVVLIDEVRTPRYIAAPRTPVHVRCVQIRDH